MTRHFIRLLFALIMAGSLPAHGILIGSEYASITVENKPTSGRFDNKQMRIFYLAEQHYENLTPQERERIQKRREKFKSLPPEEQQRIRKARDKYKKMPPEERKRLKEKWRKMTPEERRKHTKNKK